MEEFYDEKGISQNFSSPCTPEQNGVAERRNRTLIEAARTMLNSANLPKIFWGEAVNTACYTQNRSIIVKRHGKIAYDVFRGRSPDISYFYVFGCPVHIHNHRDHLGKFDAKVDDGFFLGYSSVAKAFMVFNIIRQETEETYHVTFSENNEAISKSTTEGMIVISYVPAYDPLSTNNITIPDPITPSDPITLTDPITSSEPIFTSNESLDFIVADNHHVLNKHDDFESVEDLGDDVDQVSLISEPISEDEPSTIDVSPLTEVFSNPHIPQDRWSREKHIEYQANPKESHLVAVKRIFRYLKGTPNLGLCKAQWLCHQLRLSMLLLLDAVLKSFESKVTWLTMMFFMTRDHILKGDIELHFLPTELQLADIFTKPLAEPSFTRLVAELGMLNIEKEVPDKKNALSDALT
ncbi:retrovirus-related pol polyprotein from transposon TNT 1-94 [Tanacetum coccineum]